VPPPSRASPLPQGISVWIEICASPQNTVGAWLARESGESGDRDVECADAFASKPAPTGSGGAHSNRAHHKNTVGACLQAIAVGQATWILNGLAPSRAGSLPQGLGAGPGFPAHPDPLWDRGLPAKAVGQATEMLNVPPPSRASPLPRGISVSIRICGLPQILGRLLGNLREIAIEHVALAAVGHRVQLEAAIEPRAAVAGQRSPDQVGAAHG